MMMMNDESLQYIQVDKCQLKNHICYTLRILPTPLEAVLVCMFRLQTKKNAGSYGQFLKYQKALYVIQCNCRQNYAVPKEELLQCGSISLSSQDALTQSHTANLSRDKK
jgi:hypothetical protein